MIIKQVFIVTETGTGEPADKLWYQDLARHLQSIFEVKSFLIDLTKVTTVEELAKQQEELELITRSLKDPFIIISHGRGSRMVLESQILTKRPHIMVAPYLFHSSNHTYEDTASQLSLISFDWKMIENFTDTFFIELGGDTLIDRFSHKELANYRQLHFHYVPYDGHGALTGSHNHEIPDLTAEILRIFIQRGYANENEKFLEFKKNLINHPLHVTPTIEIETLNRELALATSEADPAQVSNLLREARAKEKFFTAVKKSKRNKIDKQIAILALIFGILALLVIFLNDKVSILEPKPVTTETGIYVKAPYIAEVRESRDTVLLETSKSSQEIFLRKNYLIDRGIPEPILATLGFEDIYLIKAPKSPEVLLFIINDTSAYLREQEGLIRAFLGVDITDEVETSFSVSDQLFSTTSHSKTVYSGCISGSVCGISTDKNFIIKLKEEIFNTSFLK